MSAAAPFGWNGGPVTPTQALCLAAFEWEDLSACDSALTDDERHRVAALWVWLVGVASDDSGVARVCREVLADGGLTVALHLPAAEFLRWFKAARWEDFDSTARTRSEAWAAGVLQRAWSACKAMGVPAVQQSMVTYVTPTYIASRIFEAKR